MNRHKTRREQGDTVTRGGASTGRGGISLALSNFLTLHAQAFVAILGQLSRRPFATFMTVAVIGIALAMPAGLYVQKDIYRLFTGKSAGEAPPCGRGASLNTRHSTLGIFLI